MLDEQTEKPEIEHFERYATVVDSMQAAFAFVMEYMDQVGEYPSVEIGPCFDIEDNFEHYHVAVYGIEDGGPPKGETLGHQQ